MKEPSFPPRLSESARDPLLVRAVRAAKSDEPTPARLQNAAARFKSARALADDAGGPPRSPAGRSLLSAKAGVVVAIVVALGAMWTRQRSTADHRTDDVAPSTPVQATIAKTTTTDQPALTPKPAEGVVPVEMLPGANGGSSANGDSAANARAANPKIDPPPRLAPSAKSPSPVSASAASFDDELALVERARKLLVEGDAAGCLAELDRHRLRMRGGVFEREVGVMRIEALVAQGELARARALGQTFVAQNPDSPYADRVRSLLTQAGAPPAPAN